MWASDAHSSPAEVLAVSPNWIMSTDFPPGFSRVPLSSAIVLLSLITLVNGGAHFVCGSRSVTEKSSQSRIVGGRDAVRGAWPWQVSLQLAYTNMHVCGAAVISQYWLLSAAHCFPQRDGLNNKDVWRAVMGLTELEKADPWTTTRKVERLILHENYANLKNDVAVLKVDQPIKFGDYIRPACLPQPGVFHVDRWTQCHVTGWGLMEQNGEPAHILQEAGVELIPLETCQQSNWYGNYVGDKEICAGFAGGGIDACQGDSGGPLSCRSQDSNQFFVVGVVSWGQGCAQRFKPGVYTSTSAYGEWIEQNTGILIPQDEEEHTSVYGQNPIMPATSEEPVEEGGTHSPISMMHRNSPGQTIPLLHLLIVLYCFLISC